MFHPATLLLTWAGFAIGMQWRGAVWLIPLLAITVVLALLCAPQRSRALLWRTRWLFLSLMLLFLFATPGEYLPGLAGQLGITREGLTLGGAQAGHLLILLLSLALLHEHLGNQGLMTGFYWLLQPFSWRDMTVVRLMLVLEYVENKPASTMTWRQWLVQEPVVTVDGIESEYCRLRYLPIRAQDRLLMLFLALAMAALWGIA